MNRATSLGLAHFNPAVTSGERTSASKENDLGQRVKTELTALLTDEATRRDEQWRRTLDSFKTTLVDLEHTWEAASSGLSDQPLPAAAVSDVVERCVSAAAAERDAAVQRTRIEADTEIRRLQDLLDRSQDLVGRLESEAQIERDKLKTALEAIDKEHAARTHVEAALQEAQATSKEVAATLNAQLHAVRVALEAERAQSVQLKRQIEAVTSERAKLVDALQTVRRVVTFEETPQPPAGPDAVGHGANQTPAARTPTRAPKAADTPPPEAQAQKDLVAYIDKLLAEIEAIYWRDLGSHQNPSDVVARLTANLRYALAAVVQHGGSSITGASALFERQLMSLMDAKAETSFARHLGISAYEYAIPPDSPSRPAA